MGFLEYIKFLIKSIIYILYIFIAPIITGLICNILNLPQNIYIFTFIFLILLIPIFLEIYTLIKNRFIH